MKPTIKPTPKQHEAWMRLQDKTTEFIVYGGGKGGGKSWLGCEWLLTSCYFYPGTRYFIARRELKDIMESTMQTWDKVIKYHNINSSNLYKFNGQYNYMQFHNGSRIDLVDLARLPRDPLYERFGSLEFTSGWIEEAGEVDDLAAANIAVSTGRMHNDKYNLKRKILMTCNPKKNFLYKEYYLPWKKGELPPDKAFIQSLYKDNYKGEKDYGNVLERLRGIARQRLLNGEWEYDDSPEAMILYDRILDIFRNSHMNGGAYKITVDVARKGKDNTVIGLWRGFGVKFFKYSGLITTEVTKKVKQLQEKYLISASDIIVDSDGVGGGVADQLQCREFMNGSRPFPNPENPQKDKNGNPIPENYENLRAQCYFRLANRINEGGLYVESEDVEEIERITEELECVKQKNVEVTTVNNSEVILTGSEKKLGVISRDDMVKILGYSPDYASALMMREYFELTPRFVITAG